MFSYYFLGKVTDNQDPDSLNRIRVSKIGEDESVTDWIPVITPYAGNDTGLSLLPDVDDQVLVVSLDEHNIRKAAIGGLWSNEAAPPSTGENSDADLNQDGNNSLRFFKSRSGSMVIFDDTEGEEKIQIISSDGKSRFEFLNADEMVSLTTENDLTIGAKGVISIQAEEIEINSKKQLNLTGEEFQIAAKKAMDITSDQDITVKGSGIALN
ncbi:phage baseplate assembly protein V [Breznakiella homolactica]|uniref:Rhs element Vgr protein n=1 Tax=Breznakiella homolactica TaxID=2798577 RepID=A0A7T7XME3_9SPIR|nr:phage baseplate assembly protein V [Breznakiella homolactica]QQO09010.1 phage baseplate assembly protein V [Breznakiella homolactica]